MPDPVTILPLTPDRWSDLESLFGKRGACGGCWCMYWRLGHKEFEIKKGEANRSDFKKRVNAGPPPGLLAYLGDEPVGWCAVAPREEFSRLARSRILKPIDRTPVWSIVCFFVARPHRRHGITVKLLKEAVMFVAEQGGHTVEGYPIEPRDGAAPDVFVYTGLASAFRKAGFKECARRSETRPIMRYLIR